MIIRSVLLGSVCSTMFAQDLGLPTGAALRQGVHVEWYRTVCPGDNGSAIFVWSDTRYGMRNVFAHKVDQNGNFLWGETGAVITDLPGRQEDPVAIEDGNGGAFIAWVDYRYDEEGDIFIQHVDHEGNLLMDPNGVALAQEPGRQITINMCTDSLGGVFVTWQDKRGGVDDDIYGTHVSASNEVILPGTGTPIVEMGGGQAAKSIEYAGNNEAFICWSDARQGENIDIYGQRLNVNMYTTFEENGTPIANTSELETRPRTTYVNGNTSLVTWKTGDDDARIMYQLIDENGPVLPEPRSVSDHEAIQTGPRVKRSDAGDVFIQWTDLRHDPVDGDLYLQKIDPNGDQQWGDGIQVDPEDGVNFSGRFAADADGGVNVFWERGVYPNIDILFQNFNDTGTPTLDEPIFISGAQGYQFGPNAISNGSNGVYGIFADQGSGSIDLRVQFLDGVSPSLDDGGTLALKGMDGDVRYNHAFRSDDRQLLLMWEDNRSTKKIYGNWLVDDVLEHANGVQVSFSDNSSAETDLSQPRMVSTGSGIYLATFDATGSPKRIRINRLDNDLVNLWDSAGVAISPEFDQRSAVLASVENGIGCFWSESRTFNYDIYFQRLDLDGNMLLGTGGVSVVSSNGDDYVRAILPAPDGNYLFFWIEEVWPASRLKYKKVDADGSTAIGWPPSGYSLSDQSAEAGNLVVKKISDTDGVLAVWNQDGNFSDIYAQKIDWEGTAQWATGGVAVTTADNDQTAISLDIDEGGNNAFIAWEDYQNGTDFNIIGRPMDLLSGDLPDEAVQFTIDTTGQQNPVVSAVAPGEFMVLWEDGRGYYNTDPLLINGVDLYGSGYIIGSGMTTAADGIPICIEYHDQKQAQVVHYEGNNYFLHWIDLRSSGKEDLVNYYARIMTKATILAHDGGETLSPGEFSLGSVYPNPFNGSVNFEFIMPAGVPAEFRVYDMTGRMISDRLILPGQAGAYRISWDGRNMLGKIMPTGIYFYKFSSNDNIYKGKISYIK